MSQTPVPLKAHGVAALKYAAGGWPVFPLHTIRGGRCSCREKDCAHPGKHPLGSLAPHGLKNATTDPDTIRRWWRQWPDANIGIVTGERSGLVVLDVDPRNGGDLSLERLLQRHGPLPPTMTSVTGSGGRHYVFRHPGRHVKSLSNAFGEDLSGLDIKGDGGYFVAPPSLHISRKRYAWEATSLEPAPLPESLAAFLAQSERRGGLDLPDDAAQIREGERNTRLAALAGKLRREGMERSAIEARLLEINADRCMPPLDDDEVRSIAASISRYPPGQDREPSPATRLVPVAGEDDEPIPLFVDSAVAVPFPTHALPSPLRRLVEEGAQSINCPPDFLGVPLLALAGAAIGTTRVLEVKSGWQEAPRLWTALVADPGSRKSPALELVMRPLRARQERLQADYRAQKQAYRAKLAEYEAACASWKRDKAHGDAQARAYPQEPTAPLMPQIYTTDATPEALMDLLAQNPRGLLLPQDELAGWVLSMDQYKGRKGSDRQTWLSLWTGAQVVINRRNRQEPLLVPKSFIAVAGALPPDVLGELSDERGREDGFVHRILFAFPDRLPGKWTEEDMADATVEEVGDVLERLWQLEPMSDATGTSKPVVVPFTSRGRERWVEWINEHFREQEYPEFPEYLRGPWSKLNGYCAGLALILQESRYACGEAASEDVDEQSVAGAVALIGYFKSHARLVYVHLRATPEDKQVAAAVAWVRQKGGQVTAREVQRSHVVGVRTVQDVEELFRKLEQHGCGVVEEFHPVRGRKSQRFTLTERATVDNNPPTQIRSAS